VIRILIVGHGRMGRLVEAHAAAHGCEIAGIVTSGSGPRAIADAAFGGVDVAIDFSSAAAVRGSLEQLAARRISAVIGTTGWQRDEAACRKIAADAGIGVIAAANFSIGMTIFRLVVADAARRFAAQADVGAWIHELHHAAKKDAPSGTALMLKSAMEAAGYDRRIDVSSSRAGAIPGTHEIGFDAAAETVTMTHTVRDRAVFAHGALEAAKWLRGRTGWFGIEDVIRT
jgi:4-hydroxy-tetrahydrodipicolinate reductase